MYNDASRNPCIQQMPIDHPLTLLAVPCPARANSLEGTVKSMHFIMQLRGKMTGRPYLLQEVREEESSRGGGLRN